MKQQREELEVRVSALKSQYDGRLSRQERELRDLRGQQERQEQRDEPQEAGPSKVSLPQLMCSFALPGQQPRIPSVIQCLSSRLTWNLVLYPLFTQLEEAKCMLLGLKQTTTASALMFMPTVSHLI